MIKLIKSCGNVLIFETETFVAAAAAQCDCLLIM